MRIGIRCPYGQYGSHRRDDEEGEKQRKRALFNKVCSQRVGESFSQSFDDAGETGIELSSLQPWSLNDFTLLSTLGSGGTAIKEDNGI